MSKGFESVSIQVTATEPAAEILKGPELDSYGREIDPLHYSRVNAELVRQWRQEWAQQGIGVLAAKAASIEGVNG